MFRINNPKTFADQILRMADNEDFGWIDGPNSCSVERVAKDDHCKALEMRVGEWRFAYQTRLEQKLPR
jgi:hypothetical protein